METDLGPYKQVDFEWSISASTIDKYTNNYKASLFVLLCRSQEVLEADQNNNLSKEPSQPGQ